MDTKFSVALHILVYIAETDKVASSEALAKSVNTNASHIRKITRLLKQAELLTSQQGKSGFSLAKEASEIDLAKVYRAVYPEKSLLNIHEDPNPACPVGQHIGQVLEPTFRRIEEDLMTDLAKESLADLIQKLYQKASN
ncbi:Rrf2 family transcriptional regulator [Streptococcus loxodontisalivarius]|uniref:Rrf2 family protein n=1 Tax=Streptococcus loxodontisalivarius TaxID=1349415 RepID=A0ABS2PSS7_9STRE|nr:Rrf2 family transcriptional regulator [Streptococcus loxodontisalivarius]MBM7642983.1 Rrf2 family protein [Streptococcus loxodontisalivarius]